MADLKSLLGKINEEAIDLIRQWHGLGHGAEEPRMWQIYFSQAPEMKRLTNMFMELDKMICDLERKNTRHTQDTKADNKNKGFYTGVDAGFEADKARYLWNKEDKFIYSRGFYAGIDAIQQGEDTKAEWPEKPKIVCLCGSTRFYKQFQKANYVLTMEGKIVLSVGFYPHSSEQAHGGKIGITPEQKEMLDELHLKKIDLADEVFIINPDGYIGESTRKEYEYALKKGKLITSYEPIGTGTQTDEAKGG